MLRRLHVTGFKSLEDVELELPALAVLVGPNAAGKSNVFDAIQTLARLGTERTLTDALGAPIRGFPQEAFAFPPGGLPELLERRAAEFTLVADIDLMGEGESSERVRYRVTVAIDPDTGRLSLADEYMSQLGKSGKPKHKPRIEESDGQLVIRPARAGHPAHERLGLNHTLLSDTRLSGPSYSLLERLRAELRSWRTYYLDPGGEMRREVPPSEVEDIGVHGQDLAPFLFRLKNQEPERFSAVRRALRAVIPSVTKLDVDLHPKRGSLDIEVEQDGTMFSSRVISEGTLRIIALCALAVSPGRHGLIGFEEPENGVTPQRIDRIASLLCSLAERGGPQLILTTHSPAFAAAALRSSREGGVDMGLFAVGRKGSATVVRKLPDPGPLLEDPEIDELLREADEEERLAVALSRGLFDA